MAEPYLILHCVRGQPAFDIAERVEMIINNDRNNTEVWWIIPTSGHRAYPLEVLPLSDLEDRPTNWSIEQWQKWTLTVRPIADYPDHYPTSTTPHSPSTIGSLAERLGLVPKAPVITRRL